MKHTGKIKKVFSKFVSGFLAAASAVTMVAGLGTVTASAYSNQNTPLNPQQLVNAANSAAAAGTYNGSGYKNLCLAFVATIVRDTYNFQDRSTSCCAYNYGSLFMDKVTTSWENVPAGADIFFGGSNVTCNGHKAGHVGIYVGNGQIVHAWGGKIQKTTVQYVINCGYPMRGWGWHGNYNFTNSVQPSTFKTIKNYQSGKMLNVVGNSSANGANVTVYQQDGTTGQNFKLNAHGGTKYFGGVAYQKYTLEAQCSPNRRLNVYGSTSVSGNNVNLWTTSGNDTQDWILTPSPYGGAGYYIIRSANNTSCVLTEAGTANGSNVQISTYQSGNKNQIWYLGTI